MPMATIATGACLVLVILALFSTKVQEEIAARVGQLPRLIFLFPVGIFACYLAYAWGNNAFDPDRAIRIFCYLFIPTILLAAPTSGWTRAGLVIAAIVLLRIPFDVDILSKSWGGKQGWNFMAISSAILMFGIFRFGYGISGMKYAFPTNSRSWLWVLGGLLALLVVLVPLGFVLPSVREGIPFLVLDPKFQGQSASEFLAAVVANIFTLKFFGTFLVIAFVIALPEETWARCINQNLLVDVLGNKFWALIIASCVFGMHHFNNDMLAIWPPSQWNWPYVFMASIAGVVYGVVFMKTESVVYPVVLHSLVDTINHTFFLD